MWKAICNKSDSGVSHFIAITKLYTLLSHLYMADYCYMIFYFTVGCHRSHLQWFILCNKPFCLFVPLFCSKHSYFQGKPLPDSQLWSMTAVRASMYFFVGFETMPLFHHVTSCNVETYCCIGMLKKHYYTDRKRICLRVNKNTDQ